MDRGAAERRVLKRAVLELGFGLGLGSEGGVRGVCRTSVRGWSSEGEEGMLMLTLGGWKGSDGWRGMTSSSGAGSGVELNSGSERLLIQEPIVFSII